MFHSQVLLLTLALLVGSSFSSDISGTDLEQSKNLDDEGGALQQHRQARALLPYFLEQKEKEKPIVTTSGVTKVSPLTMKARLDSMSPEEVIRRMYHRPMYDNLMMLPLRDPTQKKKRKSMSVSAFSPLNDFIMRHLRSQAAKDKQQFKHILESPFYADAVMRQL